MRHTLLLISVLAIANTGLAQTDSSVIDKIRDEGLNRSQVVQTLSYLSDVIGPRLTGSPSLKRANEWTRDKMTSWGLSNAHLEKWGPFGRGWQLDRFSAQIISPQDIPLISFPKAWSPGIRGPVIADVVLVDVQDEAGLEKLKGTLKGKVVLSGGETPIPARFVSQGTRYTDAELEEMTKPQAPRQRGGPGRPGNANLATFRARAALAGARLRFFQHEGVLAVLDESRGDDGTIYVQSASVPPPAPAPANGAPAAPPARGPSVWDKSAPKTLPQITVSAEQYNRLVRMINQGEKLKIDLDLKVSFFDKDLYAYNTVGEIPGSDLKDQVVMAGGHMDSWHAGTGATDNGAGLCVALEAVRILKALNLQPRRTIRVALWSGEEEGLFGSQAYVAQHFGSYPKPMTSFGGGPAADRGALTKQPDYDKISAYFNLDNGTGKIRGIYCQGNEQVASLFTDWLQPFKDLGASTVTLRNTGSTDHISFDAIGIPGFQFIQDVIEYDSRSHHSNQDVFDRVQGDDLKQASVILATFLWNSANRDEMIPRKPLASN